MQVDPLRQKTTQIGMAIYINVNITMDLSVIPSLKKPCLTKGAINEYFKCFCTTLQAHE